MASSATLRLPSVPFLKPTGMERPLAISRCVWLSVVRAPTAAQESRSAVYWGVTGSSSSVAQGKSHLVDPKQQSARQHQPLGDCRRSRPGAGSLIRPFQPTVVRGFSK